MIVAVGVRVRVPSLDAAARFYEHVLGLSHISCDGGCLVLKAGEGYVVLEEDASLTSAGAATRPTGLILAVPCPLEVFRARLEPLGARLVRHGDAPWGGIEVRIVDPFGNELMLYSSGG